MTCLGEDAPAEDSSSVRVAGAHWVSATRLAQKQFSLDEEVSTVLDFFFIGFSESGRHGEGDAIGHLRIGAGRRRSPVVMLRDAP